MQKRGRKQIKARQKSGKKSGTTGGSIDLSPERKASLVSKVKEIALPVCTDAAVVLVDVAYAKEGGRNSILRIFIDKPGGVTLDDCSRISRELLDILDVNLDMKIDFRLEVSSPGIKLA